LHFALALGATNLMTETSAAEPMPIKACQTIDMPGSYQLTQNLNATGDCLVIKANFVTIDLAGFLIRNSAGAGVAIANGTSGVLNSIAVRNGSISDFQNGVDLIRGFQNFNSIVEGVRITGLSGQGILANGIIRGNTVSGRADLGIFGNGLVTGNQVSVSGTGILGGGTVSGNEVDRNGTGILVSRGSTVIGNTATNNGTGIRAFCPSNLIDNTAVDNDENLVTDPPSGEGCHIEDNLAP